MTTTTTRPLRQPAIFIPHGAGPCFFMDWNPTDAWDKTAAYLRGIPASLPEKPKAILLVTAHWLAPQPSMSSAAQPGMLFDYYGFPPHTYQIQYPAPGAPALAAQVKQLLDAAGHPARLDHERGFDHGTFSALFPIYPQADVPLVQLSLKHGYDPLTHVEVGRALASLRRQGVLIVGSGLSYHNLRQFGQAGAAASHQFDAWLRQTMALPPEQRLEQLLAWDQAPGARQAHPQEDHLLPLMVALGAAEQEAAHVVYHEDDFFGALAVTSFKFG